MDKLSSKVELTYQFTSDGNSIPNELKNSPSVALRIEGILTIKINDTLYFQEDIALLEFYLYLLRWEQLINKGNYSQEFKFYSLEFDEGEPIISLIPFGSSARLKTIWEVNKVYNVFELDYIVNELIKLKERLGNDIEKHFSVRLQTFIGKVPLKNF
ncbi:Uncharacterised protein [Mycobacteroides abscessus subsp. abscessus]|nr:Uncharacterised protein [Mycobacteroides abscessus subsp. abscessus]